MAFLQQPPRQPCPRDADRTKAWGDRRSCAPDTERQHAFLNQTGTRDVGPSARVRRIRREWTLIGHGRVGSPGRCEVSPIGPCFFSVRPAQPVGGAAAAGCGRAAGGDAGRGVGDGRSPGGVAGGGGAHRGAARGVRHAARPADLGRRPPDLPAQDPDRQARPHPHAPPAGRPVRLHPPLGERVRPVRGGALVHLDLGRPGHGGGARPAGGAGAGGIGGAAARAARGGGNRRRLDLGRHGLRGDEQRRLVQGAPDRHPQRQRDEHRPPGGGDVGLPDPAAVEPEVPVPARPRRQGGQAPADRHRAHRQTRGRVRPRPADRRHPVRGAGVLLHRPDRRPQHGPPAAGAAQPARRRRGGPGAAARDHPEGPRLRAGGGVGRQVSRGGQVQRGHRRAEQGAAGAAQLHRRVRPRAGRVRRLRPQDRRHHRRHAVRHRARPVRQPSPGAVLRRGHRRAARGDVRRRPRHRGPQTVLRHLLDLPAARLRPGGARRGAAGPARALRHRPRRPGGARTGPRTPAASTSTTSAACRG